MADPYTTQDVLCRSDIYRFLEDESYFDFLNCVRDQKEIAYISLTLPIQAVDPLACLESLSETGDFQFFWEIPRDSLSIAAGNALITLEGDGYTRFDQIRKQAGYIRSQTMEYSAATHEYSGLNFLGGFSFDDQIQDPVWEAFGSASFFVPEWTVIKDGNSGLLTLTLDVSELSSVRQIKNEIETRLQNITPVLSSATEDVWLNPLEGKNTQGLPFNQSAKAYERWTSALLKAKGHIKDKRFDKIVLAREFKVDTHNKLSPIHIINDLRHKYPNCYSFLIGWCGRKNFIGSSPERLAAFRKNTLLTEALAGSIQRGLTTPEDAALARQLLNSPKNNGEHNFVIKAIEQNLETIAMTVSREDTPVIKKFANVQHLFTPITAKIDEAHDRFTILKNLHPTPAVGGYPWKEASAYVSELEDFSRGWYAGPIGWLNSKGDGEFTVAIRSGLVEDNIARFYAGCGIVEDSDPDSEWRETSLKLIPMLSALRYD